MLGPHRLRLLIAAYYFPPSNVVGASRVAKFVKYLLRLDVDVTVVTVDPRHYGKARDRELPGFIGDPSLRIKTTRALSRRWGVREEGLYWLPYLLPTLVRSCREHQYDAFLITGNPFCSFAAAPALRALCGIPYVLDFRDPWSLSPYRRATALNRLAAGLIRRIESTAIAHADYVLNVTDPATALYQKYYSERGVPGSRFVTIPNGVDLEDLTDVEPEPMPASFSIVYAGKFGGFRDPSPLLHAIKRLVRGRDLSPSEFRLVHVGQPEREVLQTAEKLGIDEFVTNTGHVPYRKALAHIAGASASVLISGGHPYEPTTKIFDYMGLGCRILALAPCHGFLFEQLSKYPGSLRADNTPAGACTALERLFLERSRPAARGMLPPEFSRERQALQLHALLTQLRGSRTRVVVPS
jgi:glycosyltransferase involved in cell wall biosynthesis